MNRYLLLLFTFLFGCSGTAVPTPTSDAGSTCMVEGALTPTDIHQGLTLKSGQTMEATFTAHAGHNYTVCTMPTVGDIDLYGNDSGPASQADNQAKSENYGLLEGAPNPDCISVAVTCMTHEYHLTFSARQDSEFMYFVTDSLAYDTPEGFSKSLQWPVPTCKELTDPVYGGFNTPWGNHLPNNTPFYASEPGMSDHRHWGKLHGGNDMACKPGTEVNAACTGVIHRTGDLGFDTASGKPWGGYAILECISDGKGNLIEIAYDHLDPSHLPTINSQVTIGEVIGQIYNLQVPGEVPHLHLGICSAGYDACDSAKMPPQRGALKYDLFPGVDPNPRWIDTSPNNYLLWQ